MFGFIRTILQSVFFPQPLRGLVQTSPQLHLGMKIELTFGFVYRKGIVL